MQGLRLGQIQRRIWTYILIAMVLLVGGLPIYRASWQSSAEFHTLLEATAASLAFITGTMALVRYYAKKNSTFLILGAGFLGTALLDGYHALVTSSFFSGRTPSALAA